MPNTPHRTRTRHRNRLRFKPAERREMVRLVLEEGRPINSVAREFGTCWSTVKNWVNRAQALESQSQTPAGTLITSALLGPVGGYRFISDEQKAEALRLVLDEGLSAFAAGARTGIAYSTISRWLREMRHNSQGSSRSEDMAMEAPVPENQPVEPAQPQSSSDQLFTELPFDDRLTNGVAADVVQLREQVAELRMERDFLRLVVMHFVAPTLDAAPDMKVTFTAE
jgi:transposase-like protein